MMFLLINLPLKVFVIIYTVLVLIMFQAIHFSNNNNVVMAMMSAGEHCSFFPDERDALLQLRDSASMMNSTTCTSNYLHANWTGPPCYKNQSRWAGIACFNCHVTHLVLEGIQLTGSLPPSSSFLHNLTFLSKLSFRNNSIYGPLPNLTNLVHLQFLFLSYNLFSGLIPLHYIDLPQLRKLELQNNSLQGSIPPFDQPSLTAFNVSCNHLEGSIPPTHVLQSFPESSYDHNSDLCGQPLSIPCPPPPVPPPPAGALAPSPIPIPSKERRKRQLQVWGIALIAAAFALIPFSIVLVLVCYYYHKRSDSHAKEAKEDLDDHRGKVSEGAHWKMHWWRAINDSERSTSSSVGLDYCIGDKERPVFDLDELLRASAEMMGKGKLGTTYKAVMESGGVVAVKRLMIKEMNALSRKEFVQKMQLLGNTRHENLVEIICFYHSKEEQLVVYEFVPDGNLFELLHANRGVGRVPLNWRARLSIIKGAAKGLAFLHHQSLRQQQPNSRRASHGNLKSSNVLIQRDVDTQNYRSKLGDFGYLQLLPSRKSWEKLAVGRSPEFSQGKKLTHKADVYCFGIIVLEVITGRIPGEISSSIRGNEDTVDDDLSEWVRSVVNNDWSADILDLEIVSVSAREEHDEIMRLTQIALECTDMMPEKRPNMAQVVARIEELEHSHVQKM
ncbi:probable leucine-rich repeat receptor-like protein kinase At1g68400 [Diospyros lotus]|uniref:probable leucine-rich repeat receptor-like protein kinase At1g68400 n=1 Tax=Diospyros lotus TaxID=55363 RepID=UPI00225B949E|nr:probable leucine-rich repeat receptor-like protein kinase At1g68400 [Diospyros lotus]